MKSTIGISAIVTCCGRGGAAISERGTSRSLFSKVSAVNEWGNYLLVFEIESVEARDQYWPAPDKPSEAGQSLAGQWFEKFGTFVTAVGNFTDYVVVGK